MAADEIVSLTKDGLEMSENANNVMMEALPNVDKTTRLVQEISSASLEQSNGVSEINNAIQQLNDVTQQNAAMSEELASSSEELSSQALQLKDMISYFKIGHESKVNSFTKNKNTNQRTEISKAKQPISGKNKTINKPQTNFNKTRNNQSGINLNMFNESDSDTNFERY